MTAGIIVLYVYDCGGMLVASAINGDWPLLNAYQAMCDHAGGDVCRESNHAQNRQNTADGRK